MNKILDKLSLKFGLTKIEVKTVLFVFTLFVFGVIINYTKLKISESPKKTFSYDFQDSLFKALNNKKNNESTLVKKKEKRVDSEAELLDFSNKKLVSKRETNSISVDLNININAATEKTLTELPGIGPKTAKKIVELRSKKNGFSSLTELLEVKGIGTKKLDRIKKYLYLEK